MTMAQLVLLSRADNEAHESAGKPQPEQASGEDMLALARMKLG